MEHFFRNLPFSLVTCTLFFLRLCLISFSHFFVLCFFGVHFARLAGPTTTTTGGWSNISDRQSFAPTHTHTRTYKKNLLRCQPARFFFAHLSQKALPKKFRPTASFFHSPFVEDSLTNASPRHSSF